jgi:hypothetical protein
LLGKKEKREKRSTFFLLGMVGLPGFEPGSIEPKSTSLDQASRQPLLGVAEKDNFALIIKTLANGWLAF